MAVAGLGEETGREDRSRKPSTPCSRKRRTHLAPFSEWFVATRTHGPRAIHNAAHHLLSTSWGQTGIIVGVHSVLRESLTFGDISVPGLGRNDNLMKVHMLSRFDTSRPGPCRYLMDLPSVFGCLGQLAATGRFGSIMCFVGIVVGYPLVGLSR